MWKLLKHDLQKCKRRASIDAIIILIFALLLVLFIKFFYQDTVSIDIKLKDMLSWTLLPLFVFLFGFTRMFSKIFYSRFLKDSIVNYSSYTRKTLALEPIVFMFMAAVASFIFMYGLFYLCFGSVQNQIPATSFIYKKMTSFAQFAFVYSCMIPSLILLHSSFILFFWNMFRVKELKNKKRSERVEFMAMGVSTAMIFLFTKFNVDLGITAIVISLSVVVLNGISYQLYRKRC